MDVRESGKFLGGLGRAPQICGFYFQEPHQILTVESQERLQYLGRERKSSQHGIQPVFSITEAFSPGEKTISELCPTYGKGIFPTLVPNSLPVSSREDANTCKRHSPETQAHKNDKVQSMTSYSNTSQRQYLKIIHDVCLCQLIFQLLLQYSIIT